MISRSITLDCIMRAGLHRGLGSRLDVRMSPQEYGTDIFTPSSGRDVIFLRIRGFLLFSSKKRDSCDLYKFIEKYFPCVGGYLVLIERSLKL